MTLLHQYTSATPEAIEEVKSNRTLILVHLVFPIFSFSCILDNSRTLFQGSTLDGTPRVQLYQGLFRGHGLTEQSETVLADRLQVDSAVLLNAAALCLDYLLQPGPELAA